MHARLSALVASAAFVGVFGLPAVGADHPAHAAPPVTRDRCASPLPVQPAFGSGVGTQATLQGGGYTFELFQLTGSAWRQTLQRFGVRALTGEAVATFDFRLPHDRHHYDGLTHVFRAGAHQQVCMRGPVYLDGGTSAAFIAHPRTVTLRLDGTIVGGWAWIHVRVGAAHYDVFGLLRTR